MVRVQTSRSAFEELTSTEESRAREIAFSRISGSRVGQSKLTTPPLIGESRPFIRRVSFLISNYRDKVRFSQQQAAKSFAATVLAEQERLQQQEIRQQSLPFKAKPELHKLSFEELVPRGQIAAKEMGIKGFGEPAGFAPQTSITGETIFIPVPSPTTQATTSIQSFTPIPTTTDTRSQVQQLGFAPSGFGRKDDLRSDKKFREPAGRSVVITPEEGFDILGSTARERGTGFTGGFPGFGKSLFQNVRAGFSEEKFENPFKAFEGRGQITGQQPFFERESFIPGVPSLKRDVPTGLTRFESAEKFGTEGEGLGRTTGDVFAEGAPTVLETGALIAASTTPVGASIAGSFLLGSSSREFGQAILGEDLSFKERAGFFGVGAIEAGFGGAFTRSALGPQRAIIKVGGKEISTPSNLLERQFLKEQIADLSAEKALFRGKGEPIFDEGFVSQRFVGGRGKPGGARQRFDIEARTFPLSSGDVTVVAKGFEKTTLTSIFGEQIALPSRPIVSSSIFPISLTKPAPVTRISDKFSITQGEATGFFGEVATRVGAKDTFTLQPVSGIVRETPFATEFLSGKTTRVTRKTFRQEFEPFPDLFAEGSPVFRADIEVPIKIRGKPQTFGVVEKEGVSSFFKLKPTKTPSLTKTPPSDIFSSLERAVTSERINKALRPFGRGQPILEDPSGLQRLSKTDLLRSRKAGGAVLAGVSEPSLTLKSTFKFKPPVFETGLFGGVANFLAGEGRGPLDLGLELRPPVSTPSGVGQKLSFDKIVQLDSRSRDIIDFKSILDLKSTFKQTPRLLESTISPQVEAQRLTQFAFMIPKLGQLQTQVPRQRQDQPVISKTGMGTSFDFPELPFMFPPFEPFAPRPRPPGRPFIFPPFFPALGFGEGRPRRVRPKRKFKRVPSLLASEFDITAFEPAPGEITGLVARPILVPKKKKKKKGGKN